MILGLILTWGLAHAIEPVGKIEDAGKSVLFIGDSHSVGAFGQTMDGLLRARYGDDAVYFYASCGSRAGSWITGRRTRCGYRERGPKGHSRRHRRHRTPLAENLLSEIQPAVTVVSLGGNHMGQRQDRFEEEVRHLAQRIRVSGSQCLWIGPPPARIRPRRRGLNRSEIQDLLPSVLADLCTVLDSRQFVSYPRRGGDGIHFDGIRPGGRDLARRWAQGVFEAGRPLLDLAIFGYANVIETTPEPPIFTEP